MARRGTRRRSRPRRRPCPARRREPCGRGGARATSRSSSAAAEPFAAACTRPTRVVRPVVSLQSDAPVTAAGTALNTPRPTSTARHRGTDAGPMMSSTHALVQNPIGRSVSIGCNGCPSQVPLNRSFSGPSGTTRCTTRCTVRLGASSRVSCSTRATAACSAFPAYSGLGTGFLTIRHAHGLPRIRDATPCTAPEPTRYVPVPIRTPRTEPGDAVREIPLDEITIVGALDVERTATGPRAASAARMDPTAASRRPHPR